MKKCGRADQFHDLGALGFNLLRIRLFLGVQVGILHECRH